MREHSEAADKAPVNPEARWIRVQELGLSLLLAIPASLLIITLIVGSTTFGRAATLITTWIVMSTLILGTAGVICLKYGHEKRVELRDRGRKTDGAGREPQG